MKLSKPEEPLLKYFLAMMILLKVVPVYLGPKLWVELGKLVPGYGWSWLTHGLEGVGRALQQGR